VVATQLFFSNVHSESLGEDELHPTHFDEHRIFFFFRMGLVKNNHQPTSGPCACHFSVRVQGLDVCECLLVLGPLARDLIIATLCQQGKKPGLKPEPKRFLVAGGLLGQAGVFCLT